MISSSFLRQFSGVLRIGVQSSTFATTPSNVKTSPNRLPPGFAAPNGYALYIQEFYKKSGAQGTVPDTAVAAAQKWKALDTKTKTSYQQKAKDVAEERRAAFENLPAAKKEELLDQQAQRLEKKHRLKRLNTLRQQKIDSGHPKPPLSAYAHFVKELFASKPKSNSTAESGSIMSEAGSAWKSMSATEKKKYEDAVLPEWKKYEKAIKIWKEKQKQVRTAEVTARREKRLLTSLLKKQTLATRAMARTKAKVKKATRAKPKVTAAKSTTGARKTTAVGTKATRAAPKRSVAVAAPSKGSRAKKA